MECIRMKLFSKIVSAIKGESVKRVSLNFGSGTDFGNSVLSCEMTMRLADDNEFEVGEEYNIGIVEAG